MDYDFKLPRLYFKESLVSGHDVVLGEAQTHYLKNVMRRKEGDAIRLFNSKHGEFLAEIRGLKKKETILSIERQIKKTAKKAQKIHLCFAPIAKQRQDWLIEKATELGVDSFQPVITQNTDIRSLKYERIQKQLIEASEQSERLDIPVFHDAISFEECLESTKKHPLKHSLLVCVERFDASPITRNIPETGDISVLIGPAGGFTDEEKHRIKEAQAIPVHLGENILRCETAAIFVLSVIVSGRI